MGPMSNGSGGDENTAPPRRYGPPPVDAYMAAAYHWDTAAVWATAGQRSKTAAEDMVKSACERAMGSECSSLTGVNNVYLALAIDENGIVFGGSEVASAEKAKARAIARCEEHSFGCRIGRVINPILIPAGTGPEQDFSASWLPDGPIRRHSVAAIAGPEGKVGEPWAGKIWLLTGAAGFEAASTQAVAACEKQTGGKCKSLLAGAVKAIGLVFTGTGQVELAGLPETGDLNARVREICRSDSKGCALVARHETVQAGLRVIDTRHIERPLRGYFAVARATKGPDGLAFSAGHPGRLKAEAAALAQCRANGSIACAIDAGGSYDSGLGPFLAAFIDQSGGTLYEYGVSADNARERAEDWCLRDNRTCQSIDIFDLTAIRQSWLPIRRGSK